MREPRELFLHELKDIYYVEKTPTKTLPRLAAETKDRELASGLKAHLRRDRSATPRTWRRCSSSWASPPRPSRARASTGSSRSTTSS